MVRSKALLFMALTGMLAAQALPEDPVLKVRAQRAQSQGVSPDDLPPVPKTVMEPPPLPPPETNPKDLRRVVRKGKGKRVVTTASRTGKSATKATAAKRAKKKAR